VSTPRRNSRSPRLQASRALRQPISTSNQIQDHSIQNHPKPVSFSVIRRFIGIESHASESYYHSYTVATSGVNRFASQICHNRLFREKLQQNILCMISTEVSSLAAHNTTNRWPWRPTETQTGHSALTPAAQPQGLPSSSTALLSTTFHQSNRPLPTHPQRLNLLPPTSPPGISNGFKGSSAQGRSRSAPRPSCRQ
jgi:hypothetical protein